MIFIFLFFLIFILCYPLYKIFRFSFFEESSKNKMIKLFVNEKEIESYVTNLTTKEEKINIYSEKNISNLYDLSKSIILQKKIIPTKVCSENHITLKLNNINEWEDIQINCYHLESEVFVQTFKKGFIEVPKKEGNYIFEIDGIWKNEDICILFFIEVCN